MTGIAAIRVLQRNSVDGTIQSNLVPQTTCGSTVGGRTWVSAGSPRQSPRDRVRPADRSTTSSQRRRLRSMPRDLPHFTVCRLQFYRVIITAAFYVYGGAQDNGSICGPSHGEPGGIRTSDWAGLAAARFPAAIRKIPTSSTPVSEGAAAPTCGQVSTTRRGNTVAARPRGSAPRRTAGRGGAPADRAGGRRRFRRGSGIPIIQPAARRCKFAGGASTAAIAVIRSISAT
jgi:hypothetical protein